MRVTLRDVVVVNVWVSDHRLIDDVEVDNHFGVILSICIRSQWWFLTRVDLVNALVSNVDEAL